jgi:hypothetical protein
MNRADESNGTLPGTGGGEPGRFPAADPGAGAKVRRRPNYVWQQEAAAWQEEFSRVRRSARTWAALAAAVGLSVGIAIGVLLAR